MRKVLLLATLAVALCALALGASSAHGAWANCRSFGCVNQKLNALHHQQKMATRLLRCEQVAPVTQYGDPFGSFGYLFDNNDGSGPFFTSALDITTSGDPVSAWVIVDVCHAKARLGSGLPKATLPQGAPLTR